MKVKNSQLFPLAKFLVETQQKKLGFTINNLILVEEPETAGGYYDHKSKTIGLNIAGLSFLRNKYEINDILRVAAAVVLEECYHAFHHGEDCNSEDLACWYGSSQAKKIPHELLVAQGGQLYKNTITSKKEKIEMILKDIPVTVISGGMFDFVNKVKNMNSAEKETQYGTLHMTNDAHTSTLKIKSDVTKLDALKKAMGNIGQASFEYTGMIYVYSDGVWASYVDVDDNQMVKVDMTDVVNVNLTKHEEGEHLEISAS